jgi:futalosine hydrolase
MSLLSKQTPGLILAATAFEIKPFLQTIRTDPDHYKNWDVLITGPGLMATSYHLSKYISLKRPSRVIMAGIAGSFDSSLEPGTVVMVKEDLIADEGVLEKKKWHSMVDLGLRKKNQFPFKNGWLKNDHPLLKLSSLKKVRGITVNQISAQRSVIDRLIENFDPAIESMEGAALHFVCLMEQIPFMQLRAVSNQVGIRNKQKWNFSESITNLNKELTSLLEII